MWDSLCRVYIMVLENHPNGLVDDLELNNSHDRVFCWSVPRRRCNYIQWSKLQGVTDVHVCVCIYNNCDAWYTWIFAWNRMATFWTLDIISLCHNVTMRQELALHWCLRSFLTDRHFFVRGGGEATVAGAPRGATGPLAGCSSASWCVMELEPEYVVSCGFRNWRVNGLTKKIGTTNMILI